jgi:precorrin-3B synthase
VVHVSPANGPWPEKVEQLSRTRADLCPGALRPWPADDGLLVRLRLIGGRVSTASLRALVGVAEKYGDGLVHVTTRANLQVRGLPAVDGRLDPEVLAAIEETGLLPTRTHELVRNVMASPGRHADRRADLGAVLDRLDAALCADETLTRLPGRFLFVLDDGRGDLVDRTCDLGLVVLDPDEVQLRVGRGWGAVVPLASAADELARLARAFVDRRGSGPSAPWHVAELDEPLVPLADPDPRLPEPSGPLPFGAVEGGLHVVMPDTGIDRATIEALTEELVIVTPWRGLLLPDPPEETR